MRILVAITLCLGLGVVTSGIGSYAYAGPCQIQTCG